MNFRIWKETIGVQVLQYLPDTIQTFSNQSRKTVSFLIQNVKADKSQISSLVANLRDFNIQANYTPTLALRYSPMNIEGVIEFFRDSSLRVSQLFSASSSISNVLNSMISIFSSEIEKIEKDIYYLENFIDNYQFISGEDDLFNFNYIENFDNDLSNFTSETNSIELVDRDGKNFEDNGSYYIDSVLSNIGISKGKSFINIISNYEIGEYISNYNRDEMVTTDTGFESCINESQMDSWTVTIKSPYAITSQLKDIEKYVNYDFSYIRGAQVKVELSFKDWITSDFIRLTPNISGGLQLLQAIVVGTSAEVSQNTSQTQGEIIEVPVLSSPLQLDKTVDVVFSKMLIQKVIFIFNQSEYTRKENTPIIQELNSKFLSSIINNIREKRNASPSKIQDLVYFYYKNNTDILKARSNKKNYTEIYSYRYPKYNPSLKSNVGSRVELFTDSEIESKVFDLVDEGNASAIANIVQTIVQHSIDARENIFSSGVYRSINSNMLNNRVTGISSDGIVPLKNDISDLAIMFQRQDAQVPSVSSLDITKYLNSRETPNAYEYAFSIKNITFGITSPAVQDKACFISSRIDAGGSPIAAKAIVNIVNQRKNLNYYNYDLRESGSYELSLSLKDVITSENDWIPLTSSKASEIDSEVLFFNSINRAKLRFKAIPATISLYKNGIFKAQNLWNYIDQSNEIQLIEALDPDSVYVCSYTLDKGYVDPTVLDLDSLADYNIILNSYSSNGRQGEYFPKTGPGNKIKLTHVPYIEDKFENSFYNSDYGTLTSGVNSGYYPITILLEDGTPAVNLTNYTGNSFIKPRFYETDQYLYIQNGRDILFNRSIDQPITVSYKYLPSNLRFRLIMRSNLPNEKSNIRVDNVIIKCKVKNLDTISEKLLRLT